MASLIDYKFLKVVDQAINPGAQALNDNFKIIADTLTEFYYVDNKIERESIKSLKNGTYVIQESNWHLFQYLGDRWIDFGFTTLGLQKVFAANFIGVKSIDFDGKGQEYNINNVYYVSHPENVKKIDLSNSTIIGTVNVSNMTKLTDLTLNGIDNITSINASNCGKLVSLSIDGARALTSVDVTGCSSLKELTVSNFSLTSITGYTQIPFLEKLKLKNLASNIVLSIDFASLPQLKELRITGYTINTLTNLTQNLEILDFSDSSFNNFSNFNFNFPQLRELYIGNTIFLTNLDLSKFISLNKVTASGSALSQVSNIHSLKSSTFDFVAISSALTSIDFSNIPQKIFVNVNNCSSLLSVNLRNNVLTGFVANDCGSLTTVDISDCLLADRSIVLANCFSLNNLNVINLNGNAPDNLSAILDLSHCNIATLNLTGVKNFRQIIFSNSNVTNVIPSNVSDSRSLNNISGNNNYLDDDSIDAILNMLYSKNGSASVSNNTVNLINNSNSRSSNSDTAYNWLTQHGWLVMIDGIHYSTFFTTTDSLMDVASNFHSYWQNKLYTT